METKFVVLLILSNFVAFSFSGIVRNDFVRKSYAEHRVVRTFPENAEHQFVISDNEREECQFLKRPKMVGIPVDFLCVNSDEADKLLNSLSESGLRSEILAVDLESPIVRSNRAASSRQQISLDRYLSYDEMMDFLKDLESNPKYSSFLKIDWGEKTTVEGRSIPIVTIGTSPLGTNTRSVYIDSGIHAREWIASATALQLIARLVEMNDKPANYQNDDRLKINWHIIPCLNPDGYEYSRTTDRMWRKNRALAPEGSPCQGVDLNRNYDVEGYGVGASEDPCTETYKGRAPNSEPEVKRATTFLMNNQNNIRASISLHSYGKLILTSWGYKSQLPVDNDKLMRFGNDIADSIKKVSGRIYKVGAAGVIFYAAGGASDDFAKAKALIPYVVTIELPEDSFVLSEDKIESVSDEMWESMNVVATFVKDEELGPDPAHQQELIRDG